MFNRALALGFATALLLVLSTDSLPIASAVLHNWISSALPLVPLSLAAAIIVSCGQIDLASGSLFGLVGMVIVAWTHQFGAGDVSVLAGCLVAWAIAIVLYFLMYVLVVFGRIPALLCTLGLLFCGKGLSILLQSFVHSAGGHFVAESVQDTGSMSVPLVSSVRVFGWTTLWISGLIVLANYWRYVSNIGLQHIAVGMDAKAAEIAGVKITKVYFVAFLVSGFLVGLSSLLFLVDAQRGGWAVNIGWGKELFAIAAAVIGGCKITGGRFDPICVSLATLLLFGVQETTSALPHSAELEYLSLGVGVIAVSFLDSWIGLRRKPSLQTVVPKNVLMRQGG